MSGSLAAAKKRRAGITPSAPEINTVKTQQPTNSPNGLTLQQVIAVIDKRLISLETHMNESKNTSQSREIVQYNVNGPQTDASSTEVAASINEIIEEFQNRFIILADELSSLKDIVLKLQSYTMEVNKTLMEERVHIFSDLGEDNKSVFVLQEDSEPVEETISEKIDESVEDDFVEQNE